MGYRYEVRAWRMQTDNPLGPYDDEFEYFGNSLIKAVLEMWKAKRDSGCVTLRWR